MLNVGELQKAARFVLSDERVDELIRFNVIASTLYPLPPTTSPENSATNTSEDTGHHNTTTPITVTSTALETVTETTLVEQGNSQSNTASASVNDNSATGSAPAIEMTEMNSPSRAEKKSSEKAAASSDGADSPNASSPLVVVCHDDNDEQKQGEDNESIVIHPLSTGGPLANVKEDQGGSSHNKAEEALQTSTDEDISESSQDKAEEILQTAADDASEPRTLEDDPMNATRCGETITGGMSKVECDDTKNAADITESSNNTEEDYHL